MKGEPKEVKETVRVVFMGNYNQYEFEKEYELDIDEAVRYLAIGCAKIVSK